MKKLLFCGVFILLSGWVLQVSAANVIYKTTDGTKLRCYATKQSGSIEEYGNKVTDEYTFQKGRVYSDNLIKTFARTEIKRKQKPMRAYRLKVTDDKITFNEIYGTPATTIRKWSTIDRKTGAYSFESYKLYLWGHYKRLYSAKGKCSIVK